MNREMAFVYLSFPYSTNLKYTVYELWLLWWKWYNVPGYGGSGTMYQAMVLNNNFHKHFLHKLCFMKSLNLYVNFCTL